MFSLSSFLLIVNCQLSIVYSQHRRAFQYRTDYLLRSSLLESQHHKGGNRFFGNRTVSTCGRSSCTCNRISSLYLVFLVDENALCRFLPDSFYRGQCCFILVGNYLDQFGGRKRRQDHTCRIRTDTGYRCQQ